MTSTRAPRALPLGAGGCGCWARSTVLELRFLKSCSVRETAAELGVSVGNAKVLQHRALRWAAPVVEEVDQ